MCFGSVCSGIEAASVAWHSLGWRAAWFAETSPFPSAVLAHHYPEVPNLGDFTTIGTDAATIDLLVGGTPCQDFSVAGLRAGFTGERGNLTLEFVRLAQRTRARWLVWENVPGILSIDGGRAFGAFLGGLAQLGYGFAYRVLDAQHFGVPQRRRRVFVVGYLGDWRRAAAVLFERESLRGNPPPRREAGEGVAGAITRGASDGGGWRLGPDEAAAGQVVVCGDGFGRERARALTTSCQRLDPETETLIAHFLRATGHDASEDGTGRGTPIVAGFYATGGGAHGLSAQSDLSPTLKNGTSLGYANAVSTQEGVRRLTPRECERLQGFPGNWTLVPYRGKPAADGPRYEAIGNSMAVPVMRWIRERIEIVERMAPPVGVLPLETPIRAARVAPGDSP